MHQNYQEQFSWLLTSETCDLDPSSAQTSQKMLQTNVTFFRSFCSECIMRSIMRSIMTPTGTSASRHSILIAEFSWTIWSISLDILASLVKTIDLVSQTQKHIELLAAGKHLSISFRVIQINKTIENFLLSDTCCIKWLKYECCWYKNDIANWYWARTSL